MNARVVNEDGNRPGELFRLVHDGRSGVEFCHVATYREGSFFAKLRARLFQLTLATSDEHHVRARRDKTSRYAETKSGAAAGDERSLSRKVKNIEHALFYARQPVTSEGVS